MQLASLQENLNITRAERLLDTLSPVVTTGTALTDQTNIEIQRFEDLIQKIKQELDYKKQQQTETEVETALPSTPEATTLNQLVEEATGDIR